MDKVKSLISGLKGDQTQSEPVSAQTHAQAQPHHDGQHMGQLSGPGSHFPDSSSTATPSSLPKTTTDIPSTSYDAPIPSRGPHIPGSFEDTDAATDVSVKSGIIGSLPSNHSTSDDILAQPSGQPTASTDLGQKTLSSHESSIPGQSTSNVLPASSTEPKFDTTGTSKTATQPTQPLSQDLETTHVDDRPGFLAAGQVGTYPPGGEAPSKTSAADNTSTTRESNIDNSFNTSSSDPADKAFNSQRSASTVEPPALAPSITPQTFDHDKNPPPSQTAAALPEYVPVSLTNTQPGLVSDSSTGVQTLPDRSKVSESTKAPTGFDSSETQTNAGFSNLGSTAPINALPLTEDTHSAVTRSDAEPSTRDETIASNKTNQQGNLTNEPYESDLGSTNHYAGGAAALGAAGLGALAVEHGLNESKPADQVVQPKSEPGKSLNTTQAPSSTTQGSVSAIGKSDSILPPSTSADRTDSSFGTVVPAGGKESSQDAAPYSVPVSDSNQTPLSHIPLTHKSGVADLKATDLESGSSSGAPVTSKFTEHDSTQNLPTTSSADRITHSQGLAPVGLATATAPEAFASSDNSKHLQSTDPTSKFEHSSGKDHTSATSTSKTTDTHDEHKKPSLINRILHRDHDKTGSQHEESLTEEGPKHDTKKTAGLATAAGITGAGLGAGAVAVDKRDQPIIETTSSVPPVGDDVTQQHQRTTTEKLFGEKSAAPVKEHSSSHVNEQRTVHEEHSKKPSLIDRVFHRDHDKSHDKDSADFNTEQKHDTSLADKALGAGAIGSGEAVGRDRSVLDQSSTSDSRTIGTSSEEQKARGDAETKQRLVAAGVLQEHESKHQHSKKTDTVASESGGVKVSPTSGALQDSTTSFDESAPGTSSIVQNSTDQGKLDSNKPSTSLHDSSRTHNTATGSQDLDGSTDTSAKTPHTTHEAYEADEGRNRLHKEPPAKVLQQMGLQ